MRTSVSCLAAALTVLATVAQVADAHTMVTVLSTGGAKNPEGKCIREWWSKGNLPVADVTSNDMRCRTSDLTGAKTESCLVGAGTSMSIEFHSGKGAAQALSEPQTGPVIVYMAPFASNGEGDVWFKVYEDGWTKDGGWASEKLTKNKGVVSFKIPPDIRDGKYLLRAETIALSANAKGVAQFYPNCAHISVMDGGNITPKGVAIPGAYTANDPGIAYAPKKGDNSGYVPPGPAVYTAGGSSTGGGGSTPSGKQACVKKVKRSKRSHKMHGH